MEKQIRKRSGFLELFENRYVNVCRGLIITIGLYREIRLSTSYRNKPLKQTRLI